MRAFACAVVAVCLTCIASPVVADDDPADRPAFLPALTVKGTTSGSGTISVGLDWLAHATNDFSISVKPTFEAQSADGVASLLSLSDGSTSLNAAWLAGADFTIRTEQPLVRLSNSRTSPAEIAAYRSAALRCLDTDDLDPDFAAGFTERAPSTSPFPERIYASIANLDYQALCPAGKKIVEGEEATAKRPLPTRQYSMGVRAGKTTMAYLKPGPTPATLVEDEAAPWNVRVGLNAVSYDPQKRFTVEGGFLYSDESTASPDLLKWCVARDPIDTTPTDASDATTPTESCSERPGAPPTESRSLRGQLALGYVTADGTARGAMSFFVELGDSADSRTPVKAGLAAPLYLQRSSADYSGLIRATPSVAWSQDSAGNRSWQASVTIALLGARNLFPTALE